VGETPLDVLRSYLAFHFINNQAPYLSDAYRDAHFDFFKRTLYGIEEQRPRNLAALQYVSSNLGEVLGRLYVDSHFPPENKALMEQYIHYIRESFRERLEQSTWMDQATKAEAFSKLDKFVAKIGYPDHVARFQQHRDQGLMICWAIIDASNSGTSTTRSPNWANPGASGSGN
jgi:putative endopeptidase